MFVCNCLFILSLTVLGVRGFVEAFSGFLEQGCAPIVMLTSHVAASLAAEDRLQSVGSGAAAHGFIALWHVAHAVVPNQGSNPCSLC